MTNHGSAKLVHEAPPEPWLTAEEVAALAGLTPRAIRAAARRGHIPGERVRLAAGPRHRWRFRWSAVAAALTAEPITTDETEEKN